MFEKLQQAHDALVKENFPKDKMKEVIDSFLQESGHLYPEPNIERLNYPLSELLGERLYDTIIIASLYTENTNLILASTFTIIAKHEFPKDLDAEKDNRKAAAMMLASAIFYDVPAPLKKLAMLTAQLTEVMQ